MWLTQLKRSEHGVYILETPSDCHWLDDLLQASSQDGLQTAEIGLDVETKTHKRNAKQPNPRADSLVGVGLAIQAQDEENPVCVYGLASKAYLEVLRERASGFRWYAHNSLFDATVLRQQGIKLGSLVGDPRIIAYLLGEPEADLKTLLAKWLNFPTQTYTEILESHQAEDISQVPIEAQADYCAFQDAAQCMKLARVMEAKLPERSKDVYTGIELPMTNILVEMSERGIRFDRDAAQPILAEDTQKVEKLDAVIAQMVRDSGFQQQETRNGKIWEPVCKGCRNGKIKRQTCVQCGGSGKLPPRERGFNPASADQLREWLYGYLHAPLRRYANGLTQWQANTKRRNGETAEGSTDSLALLQLKDFHPVIPLILARRKAAKRKGFVAKWLELSEQDGRLHTSFKNTTVVSGRLSSSDPNLMQVQQELRSLMTADP